MHHALLFRKTLAAAALTLPFLCPARAETPLHTTLGPGYVLSTNVDVASIGARDGDVLTFSLLGEATGWAAEQTFGIVDGQADITVFEGAASAGALAHHVVEKGFDGILFNSHSGDPAQRAPGGVEADYQVWTSESGGITHYAFAYEDDLASTTDDHNDMVIGLDITRAVPETSTFALVLAGLALVVLTRRRQR